MDIRDRKQLNPLLYRVMVFYTHGFLILNDYADFFFFFLQIIGVFLIVDVSGDKYP